jgi:hypothetical protein
MENLETRLNEVARIAANAPARNPAPGASLQQ